VKPGMTIREVEETDAEALLALHRALDQETAFMLIEPGERSPDIEAERERIRNVRSRSNQTLLVADIGGGWWGMSRFSEDHIVAIATQHIW